MFKQMKLGTKLMVAFLAVGIIPFAIAGTVALNKSSKALSNLAYGQLEGMRGVKKANATMVTSAISGAFEKDPKTRAEFMELIGRRRFDD